MRRGSLQVYLGAAPGVGKTYAMLNEARLRRQRGTDVAVGLVETHGRAETAACIADLEVVPRRHISYRGLQFEEMNIDAVLAREPDLALVDELAHTNVPGSRNAKRWQDVEELLAAGIDVLATLNIQHLESLNDVVAGITGVRQQETIPDEFVRGADQIELVDIPPETLRRRLSYGNVYAPEKVDAALRNYFRPGNLGALRELALLWTADRVDEALQRYRTAEGISGEWETRERVLVALTGEEGSEHLVRRAARIAARSRGELLGAHVQASDGLTSARPARIDHERQLLEGLGGSYREVAGADIAVALVQLARAENVTQIVLGASRRSRWAELLRGSVINRVIRSSGDIDVQVISRYATDGPAQPQTRATAPRMRLAAVSTRRRLWGLALTAAGLPALSLLLVPHRESLGLPTVLLGYLLLAVIVASIGGVIPATAAAIAGFLLANYFFTRPYGSLAVASVEDLAGVTMFLVVTGVVSLFVDRTARRTRDAARSGAEAETLAGLLMSADVNADPVDAVLESLRSTLGLEAVGVVVRKDGDWTPEGSAGPRPPSSPEAADDTVAVSDDVALVLRGRRLPGEDRRLLTAFANQVSSALRNRDLRRQATEAAALGEGNALRTALLSAVSHDLRTPLATIKASVTSLQDRSVNWPPAEEERFLRAIDDQTDRLNRLIGNLLDMSRISSGALDLLSRPVGLDEVLPVALSNLPPHGATIVTDVPETLPLVIADAALLERALANLVENALRYSPLGQQVRITAEVAETDVELRIVDRGPGIPERDRDRVFLPFQRMGDSGAGGVGLGLAIARGFILAMGGSLDLEDTPGGGLTAIVRLRRRG